MAKLEQSSWSSIAFAIVIELPNKKIERQYLLAAKINKILFKIAWCALCSCIPLSNSSIQGNIPR